MKYLPAFILALTFAASAQAVQVQDLVRLKGSEQNKLVGLGLVMGLNGTGDGKLAPVARQVATLIQRFADPNTIALELKDSKNVALVALSATLPAAGVREGDRVDVTLSSVGGAKSLKGGRLFLVPMKGPLQDSPIMAFAEGDVIIEDMEHPNVGRVRGGAQLTRDVMTRHIDNGYLTLVLKDEVATWPMANNIASLINGVMSPDGPDIARALDAKNVMIAVPPAQQRNPGTFISQILTRYIAPALIESGARVVINERTGTIVITGDVEISPVIISHKGLTITTMAAPAEGIALDPAAPPPAPEPMNFVPIDPSRQGGATLTDLLAAFNQLKVEAKDRIAIIKEIERSGKLHAQLIIE